VYNDLRFYLEIFMQSMKLLGNSIFLSLYLTLFGATSAISQESPKLPEDALAHARSLSSIFEKVADTITPSVVNITATRKVKAFPKNRRNQRDPALDPFRDYFGNDFFERFFPDQQQNEGIMQPAMGTGVIIDSDGHILTNNHVIGEHDDITVRLHDQRSVKAEVIGRDDRTDIAVIKIKNGKVTPASLGDSDKLKVGEWVVAAGNPFGLDNTITAGIVSAKSRTNINNNPNQYEDFIQTDAAINPGNSGGPLVNLEGQVVGINTAIFSRSGGYMGIGFAIPINMARSVFESLISSGKVVRGWLGVGIQNLSEDLAKSFKYPSSEGALVGHVEADGPAAKAGIKQGDIIVSINGETMKNINQLRNYVASLKPKKSIPVEIFRDGKKTSVDVTVQELPSVKKKLSSDNEEPTSASKLGLLLEPLNAELADRLGTDRTKGVVVAKVRPGSLASQAGILPRDIIVSINGKEITGPDDVKNVVTQSALENGLRFVVETGGMQRFVLIQSNEELQSEDQDAQDEEPEIEE
jgi:serine protease Do